MGGIPKRKAERRVGFVPQLAIFRQMADMSSEAFFLTDVNGRFLYVNSQGCQLSGFSEDELLQMTVPDVAIDFPPDRFAELVGQLKHQAMPPFESINRRRDGSTYMVEVSVARIEMRQRVYLFGVVRDITEQKRTQALLEDLSQNVLSTLEAERRRIARELHDDVGQALATVGLELNSLRRAKKDLPLEVRETLARLELGIRETVESVARLVRAYHPAELSDLGASSAIATFTREFAARNHLRATVNVDPLEGLLSDEQALHLYRIVQEALNNVAKHARASRVEIEVLRRATEITVTVRDNGRGFVRSRNMTTPWTGLGLTTMKERAHILGGALNIRRAPVGGTEVRLTIPVQPPVMHQH